ncbi:hypothetical protein EDB19DRAFT_372385 [Suillus lakei]|nr:hypothetical protein EDB19DRAFT_372385 [Suillus lakei]
MMDITEPHSPAHSSIRSSVSTKQLRGAGLRKVICIACHVVPIIIHSGLFLLYMRNFDYTITRSSRLQVDWGFTFFVLGYEYWICLLRYLTHMLVLMQLFSGEFRLTAVYDTLNAMYGSGAALAALWDQRMTATACSEATVILLYVISVTFLQSHALLALVPTSTDRVNTFVVPALSAWPDATVNTQNWNWPTILSLASKFGQLSPTAIGLGDGFLYDVISPGTTGNGTVTATEVSVTCFLAHELSYGRSVTNEPLIYINATSTLALDAIPWKDQVLYLLDSPLIEGWLNFLLTTGTAENPVIDETTVQGTWYYNSDPAGNSTWSSIDLHFAICNVSLLRQNVTVDAQSNHLLVVPEMPKSSPQWTTISALTSFASEQMVDSGVITMPFETQNLFYTGTRTCFDTIDHYPCSRNTSVGELLLMQLIGMPFSSIIPDVPINITQDTAPGGNQYFNTTPSFTVSKHQMETALSRLYAEVIWIAGELGDSGGGFQRTVAEAEVTQFVSERRLELDYTSNFIALLASCWLLVLIIRIAARGIGPSVQTSNTLSFVWLAKHSQDLTTQFARILHPDDQVLRRAGMFRVGVQDTSQVFAIDDPPDTAGADCASSKTDTKPGVFQLTRHWICGCASASWHQMRSLIFFSLKYKALGSHEETKTRRPNQFVQYWLCMSLHALFAFLNALLFFTTNHYNKQDIVFSVTSHIKTWEFGIRQCIQAYYTLSVAALVYLAQTVTLAHDLARFQSFSSLHDVRNSWRGWVPALVSFRSQFSYPGLTSPTRIFCVFCYLFSLSAISLLRPYIVSPQTYTIITTGSSSTRVAWPDPARNISALDWNVITSAALPSSQTKGVVITGLSGALLYDELSPNPGFGVAVVNATLVDANCSLLPSSFWSNADGSPQDFISVIPWSDKILYADIMTAENYLTFLVTTAMAGSAAVLQTASVSMPWMTYDGSGHEVSSAQVVGYMVACHISLENHAATVDVQSNILLDTTYNPVSSDNQWSIFPGNSPSTDQGLDWIKAPFFAKPFEGTPVEAIYWNNSILPGPCVGSSNGSVCSYTPERLLMGFLNMTQEQIVPTTFNNSTPTFNLSPLELEGALSQYFGMMIWTAAQLGGYKGGFDRATGQVEINQNINNISIHVSRTPLLAALVASFVAMVLIFALAGVAPSDEGFVRGFGVLHTIWLTTRLPRTAQVFGSTPHDRYLDLRDLRYIGKRIKVQLADDAIEVIDEDKLEKSGMLMTNDPSGNDQLCDLEKGDEENDDSVALMPTKVEATENIHEDGIKDCSNNQVYDLERGDEGTDESVLLIPAGVQLDEVTEDVDRLKVHFKQVGQC